MEKQEIRQGFLTGERALFQGENFKIYNNIFTDVEYTIK